MTLYKYKSFENLAYFLDIIVRKRLYGATIKELNDPMEGYFSSEEFNNEEWSLEHIHAQHSLKLNTQEKWKEWLLLHLDSVKTQNDTNELVEEIQKSISNERLTDVEFNSLSDRIMTMFSEQGDTE